VVMWLNSQRSILTNNTLSQRGWSGDDRTSELLVSMMDCIKLAGSLRRGSTAGEPVNYKRVCMRGSAEGQ
jgi:hypothetical protein